MEIKYKKYNQNKQLKKTHYHY